MTISQDSDCNVPLRAMRWKLALYGEPQKCPTCQVPLEFSRAWRHGVFAVQSLALLSLLAQWPIRSLGLKSLGFGALILLAPLLGLWILAPIKHQSTSSIRHRNLFLLAGTMALVLFAAGLWIQNGGL